MALQSINSDSPLANLVKQKRAFVEIQDLYELLGVPRDATQDAIRASYFSLAKLLHPDVVARQADNLLQQEAAVVFKAISEAYGILSDRRRRSEYDRLHADGFAPVEDRTKRDAASEAKIFAHKGSLLMDRRAYAEADACFRKAVELDPTNASYQSDLGLAIMNNETLPLGPRMEEAKTWLEKAVELSKREKPDILFALSQYIKLKGETNAQRRLLTETLRLNNRHIGAQREVRLLAMRSRGQVDLFESIKKWFDKVSGKKK